MSRKIFYLYIYLKIHFVSAIYLYLVRRISNHNLLRKSLPNVLTLFLFSQRHLKYLNLDKSVHSLISLKCTWNLVKQEIETKINTKHTFILSKACLTV